MEGQIQIATDQLTWRGTEGKMILNVSGKALRDIVDTVARRSLKPQGSGDPGLVLVGVKAHLRKLVPLSSCDKLVKPVCDWGSGSVLLCSLKALLAKALTKCVSLTQLQRQIDVRSTSQSCQNLTCFVG